MPGLLIFLDFKKAFDTLEWPFIRKTFKYFDFCPVLHASENLLTHAAGFRNHPSPMKNTIPADSTLGTTGKPWKAP